ncbi:MAG: hypothetical protein COY68_02995 [Candidatus Levybacteria bacterium CG_4_10_14_0_8_um_filter_35_23]|nr:MAG: hypothetical protein COY68_02995 [Candidatus Levybacteria bacterium CG_4_10_14_0_8_um_filter_35_23]
MKILALTIKNNGQDWIITPPNGVPGGGPGSGEFIIRFVIGSLLIGAILIALVFLIWGGLDYITSEGQKEKISRAKRKLTFAIVGLIIVFLAFFIVTFIGGIFNTNLIGTR